MKIYVEAGDIGGTYIVSNDENSETKFIQTDFEYPTVAKYFGWNGSDSDIDGAREFLDEIADTSIGVEDVGYFDGDSEDAIEDEPLESDPYGFDMEEDSGLLQDEDEPEMPTSDLSRFDQDEDFFDELNAFEEDEEEE
jgi:hypothetical protein